MPPPHFAFPTPRVSAGSNNKLCILPQYRFDDINAAQLKVGGNGGVGGGATVQGCLACGGVLMWMDGSRSACWL